MRAMYPAPAGRGAGPGNASGSGTPGASSTGHTSSFPAGPANLGGGAAAAAASSMAAAAARPQASHPPPPSMASHAAPVAGSAAPTQGGPPPPPPQHPPAPSVNDHTGGALASRPAPTVYLATYSSVPVYELTVRGIACMRRRADGFLNATQILKIAGIEKAKRTKILEKEILTGEHEKVQGGYGKYQGTWIPLARAQTLSATYSVTHLLQPLLELDPNASVPLAGPRKRANPNAPSASLYFRTGPGAAQAAAGKGAAAASPILPSANTAAAATAPLRASTTASPPISGPGSGGQPSQAPRFLSLRPPAPGDATMVDADLTDGLLATGLPAGTDSKTRAALEAYAKHGYSPTGVPLPQPASAAAGPSGSAGTVQQGNKRSAPSDVGDSPSRPDPKRARGAGGDSPSDLGANGSPSNGPLGPSPVKDLNLLGRSSPSASLRGARPVGGTRRAGPPDTAGLAPGARFATHPTPVSDTEAERNARVHVAQLFVEGTAAPAPGSVSQSAVDMVIDDHGHTALHWATALARLDLVQFLLTPSAPGTHGADMHRGNHAGETALHRAVLVSNAYDKSAFPALLQQLGASLHTRDFKRRTLLHHIALVSALRGRAAPARYYLACALEYIAKHEGGRYATLVDAQDEDGETALGIVARVGNGSMCKMLLDVGARKDIANVFGIRPRDWGIDGENVDEAATELARDRPSDQVKALKSVPAAPVQASADVQKQMTNVLTDLTDVFTREVKEKEQALSVAQAHLQAATRELAARRRKVAEVARDATAREETRMRTNNLWKMLCEELGWPYDKTEKDPLAVHSVDVEALVRAHSGSSMDLDGGEAATSPFDGAPANEAEELVRLRWLKTMHEASVAKLQQRIQRLHDDGVQKTNQCRRVVALCCNIPEEKIEAILDDLVASVESDRMGQVDLPRLAGFLERIKRGEGGSLPAASSVGKQSTAGPSSRPAGRA